MVAPPARSLPGGRPVFSNLRTAGGMSFCLDAKGPKNQDQIRLALNGREGGGNDL